MNRQLMPPGRYYIGDPCYSFNDHATWLKVLGASEYFDLPYEQDGLTAIAFNTAYGDGTYLDQDGREYPVDAGMIGLVPVDMADCKPTGVYELIFTEPQKCYAEGGTLHFGEIVIKTGENALDAETAGADATEEEEEY